MCVGLEDTAFPHCDNATIGDQYVIVGGFMLGIGVCTVCHQEYELDFEIGVGVFL